MKNIEKKEHMGHIGKVDSLGRIVIPSSMRKNYDVDNGEMIEMLSVDEGILIRKYQPGCMFCGSLENINLFEGRIICKSCAEKISRILK